jgi:hypothetical protein
MNHERVAALRRVIANSLLLGMPIPFDKKPNVNEATPISSIDLFAYITNELDTFPSILKN